MEIVHKPWGYYSVLDKSTEYLNLNNYQVKRLSVAPGGRLSLQSHAHRCEHWVVVSGKPTITVGGSVAEYCPDTHVYIPMNIKHRLENFTNDWVIVIETQYGVYLGEDDIIRYHDIYTRVSEK